MRRSEWQLVFFTVFTQMAVGLYVTWGIIELICPKFQKVQHRSYILNVFGLTLIFLFLGVISAAKHLGHPRRFAFSLFNLSGSWLSREGFVGFVFGSLVFVNLIRQRYVGEFRMTDKVILVIGIITGLLLVFVISRLYMLRTVPTWNNLGTPAAFFTSTFIFGVIAYFAVQYLSMARFSLEQRDFAFNEITKFSAISVLILVYIQIALLVFTWIYLIAKGGKALQGVQVLWEKFSWVIFFRLATAISGAVIIIFVRSYGMTSIFVLFPMMLIIVSEFLGRWLFYSMYQREGI